MPLMHRRQDAPEWPSNFSQPKEDQNAGRFDMIRELGDDGVINEELIS